METSPIVVTTESFQGEVMESPLPVVVDFWAPWCGPCKRIGPVLEELAEEHAGKVRVAKVNVDEEPDLAGAFGVRGIPTLIVVHRGENLGQMVGFRGKGALVDLFRDLAERSAEAGEAH